VQYQASNGATLAEGFAELGCLFWCEVNNSVQQLAFIRWYEEVEPCASDELSNAWGATGSEWASVAGIHGRTAWYDVVPLASIVRRVYVEFP
jgi:hypothetical protein